MADPALMRIGLNIVRRHEEVCGQMKRLIDLSNEEARAHFLKGSSYFNGDFPKYISFEPILNEVSAVLKGGNYAQFKNADPKELRKVNYNFIANKDGKFAWRPYELMHPAIYVSLVNVICEEENWTHIRARLKEFEGGVVDCCSAPVMSVDHHTDVAAQIKTWWQRVEQRSLTYSLEFSHLLHTDVTDCYGSLYTHSIAWALHGLPKAKGEKTNKSLLGNKIDSHIQASRYGQTNGIAQGSVLMDFVAEIVLGYVDAQINLELAGSNDILILRYRDDYRIFANSDDRAEAVLKKVSDKLQEVGMKLGVSKTFDCRNVVEGSIKPDKIAGIELQHLGISNANTIQKQLLRLHSFGQRFPNSGALRRLVGEFHTNISKQTEVPSDLDVQVAIATDIAFVSPSTFPAVAGILSHLISLAPSKEKVCLWTKVRKKMARVPYNGYLEIWLQRVTQPKAVGIKFESNEPICQIVNGESPQLWESSWIASDALNKALDVSKIVIADAGESTEVVQPEEVELFKEYAWAY
jgi:RNA-directed DNA polymerase